MSSTELRPAVGSNSTSLVTDIIEARLVKGSSYSAELTIQHQHVPGEAFITFIGIDFTSEVDVTTTSELTFRFDRFSGCDVHGITLIFNFAGKNTANNFSFQLTALLLSLMFQNHVCMCVS